MQKILYSGFFDLFHYGHLLALKEAKSFGDYLVVHIGNDQEAKCVKGELRPIIPGEERAEILRSLKFVDEVIHTDMYLSFVDLLDMVKPNAVIRNLGGFSKEEEEECKKRGIAIIKVAKHTETTTSAIIDKIKNGPKDNPQLDGVNYFLHDQNQNLLLQWRENKKGIRCPGTWAIPGGGIEKGEDALEAVIREIREETGLAVHQDQVRFLVDHVYTWGHRNRFFQVSVINPKVQSLEGKMKFFHSSELKKIKLADNQKKVIDYVIKNKR